jgi:hypothetical protein
VNYSPEFANCRWVFLEVPVRGSKHETSPLSLSPNLELGCSKKSLSLSVWFGDEELFERAVGMPVGYFLVCCGGAESDVAGTDIKLAGV